jgi:hypothetical protein
MQKTESLLELDCIVNEGSKTSYFSKRSITLNGTPARSLSERHDAQNFRLRTSDPSYASSWHVAGDPTLLVILQGEITIELRDGQTRRFAAGDMFVAEDFLQTGLEFDQSKHGHRAFVSSDNELRVLHLKLSVRE